MFQEIQLTKKCENHCPVCRNFVEEEEASIEYEKDFAFISRKCDKCGCEFKEVFEIIDNLVYCETSFSVKQKERKLCSQPFSKYYIYEDEIPLKTRISTSKDCEKCNIFDCEEKTCLIEDIDEFECMLKDSKLKKLFRAIEEIISDFDHYGDTFQTDENGEYGKDSSIEKLRKAFNECIKE